MWIIIRYGAHEALDYLSSFCNLYVYSHGLRFYVEEILKKLDPEENFFKNLENTVRAPKTKMEQENYFNKGKGINDFMELD